MKKIIILLFAACFILPQIVYAQNSRIHFSQLRIVRQSSEYTYAYLGDKMYTGTAWSSDNKTMKIVFNTGLADEVYYYHSNGKIAAYRKRGSDFKFYDTYGNRVIGAEQFRQKYPELSARVKLIQRVEITKN